VTHKEIILIVILYYNALYTFTSTYNILNYVLQGINIFKMHYINRHKYCLITLAEQYIYSTAAVKPKQSLLL